MYFTLLYHLVTLAETKSHELTSNSTICFNIHYLHVTTWTDKKLKVIKEIDHLVSKAWKLKRLFNWINCKWIIKYLLLFLNLKARNPLNNNISLNKALLLWTRTSAKKFMVTQHFIIKIILQILIFSPYREHQVKIKLSNTKVSQRARGWNWNLKIRVAETKALAFKHYVIQPLTQFHSGSFIFYMQKLCFILHR